MKAHIQYDAIRNLFIATLLEGEFSNCHGQGKTKTDAMISLLLTIRALRRKANKPA